MMDAVRNESNPQEPVYIAPLEGAVKSAWPLVPHPGKEGAIEYGVPLRAEIGDESWMRTTRTMKDLAPVLGRLVNSTPGVKVEVEPMAFGDAYGMPFAYRLHISGKNWHAPADWGVEVESWMTLAA